MIAMYCSAYCAMFGIVGYRSGDTDDSCIQQLVQSLSDNNDNIIAVNIRYDATTQYGDK